MLAATLGFMILVTVVLVGLLSMTTTALHLGERFRTQAERSAAVDTALQDITNVLRRQVLTTPGDPPDPAKVTARANEMASCHNPGDSAALHGAWDAVASPPRFVLQVPDPSGGTPIPVDVTCSIRMVGTDYARAEDSRIATLRAYVDPPTVIDEAVTPPNPRPDGLAVLEINHQVDGDDSTDVTVREWSVDGSATEPAPLPAKPPMKIEYLVVGGGGAGGTRTGGGGGGGGTVSNLGGLPLRVNPGDFQVVVGAGGVGGQPTANTSMAPAASGGDSSFNGIVAKGGGGGAPNEARGGSGASGGGGGHEIAASGISTAGAGILGQGNDGGTGINTGGVYGAGGGGGAGSVGGNGGFSRGGAGGAGRENVISGAPTLYGAGGGGGAYGTTAVAPVAGPGGVGGGGSGGAGRPGFAIEPTNGANGTGGGGGGQRHNVHSTGGSGGSGVVVIRYPGPPIASGGTMIEVGGYTVHTFSTPGTHELTVKPAVEYLVVGGGGAGGPSTGGGGGAGGVINTIGSPRGLEAGTYDVVVGAGAQGNQSSSSPKRLVGASGSLSRFGSFVAVGGGGGGTNSQNDVAPTNGAALSGGSGGGGGHRQSGTSPQNFGAGTSGQGNNGGSGTGLAVRFSGGGGGGATVAGGLGQPNLGGAGGSGVDVTLGGVPVAVGGGGGGGIYMGYVFERGSGSHGGGLGGYGSIRPTDGAPNSGGGGGGQSSNYAATGGSGGSGIVVIRYLGPQRATGGAVTQYDGYTYHRFDTPGTYSITFS